MFHYAFYSAFIYCAMSCLVGPCTRMKHPFYFLWICLACCAPNFPVSGALFISEFMASNQSGLQDADDDTSDWIELSNTGPLDLDLEGLFLTDRTNQLTQWSFPSLVLPSNGRLLVFASGKDRVDPGAELHTNFKLNTGGEFLALVDVDGQTILHAYHPPPQVADVSFGLGITLETTELVGSNAMVRAFVPVDAALSNTWTAVDFDDSSWMSGPQAAGFDRGGGYLPLIGLSLEAAMWNQQPSAYLRYAFSMSAGGAIDRLDLDLQIDDGCVAYLNGVELLRSNLIGSDAGPDRLIDFMATSGGHSGGADCLQSLRVNRDGFVYTYTTNDLIGISLTRFRGQSGSNLTTPWGEPAPPVGERHRLLDDDFNLNTGIINPGAATNPLTTDPALITPGFAIAFDQAVINRPGPDVVFFELQTTSNPVGGDVFHVSPLKGIGVSNLHSITISQYDIPYALGPRLDGFNLLSGSTPQTLSSLESQAYTSAGNRDDFRVLATGIDLSDLGYATDAAVTGLFFQAGSTASVVDPVFIAGLPPVPPTAPAAWNLTAERAQDGLEVQPFDLSEYADLLEVGTNVLAIQVANVTADDDDVLALVRLQSGVGTLQSGVHRYFTEPTPGGLNPSGSSDLGPLIRSVVASPGLPSPTNDVQIAAVVEPSFFAVTQVWLHVRVMFEAEQVQAMNPQGDGTFVATIPAGTAGPGEMLRWYVTADDVSAQTSRRPSFEQSLNSPEYFGTIIATNVVSGMPVLHRFVETPAAAEGDPGTRASLFYAGEFYDNVYIRIRGASTRSYPKKSYKIDFNDGYHFRFEPDLPRVSEINLNTTYTDPSYLTMMLGSETFRDAGSPYCISFLLHQRQNNAFFSVCGFMEQMDKDYLRRNRLDPNGALYKMRNPLSSASGNEKKTRKDESNADLQGLVDGLKRTGTALETYLFDQVNLPGQISYSAGNIPFQHVSGTHFNYYAYRDTEGSGEWQLLPWDWDRSMGLGQSLTMIHANQDTGDSISHPLAGGYAVPSIGRTNPMRGAVFALPRTREMYLRRVRTMLDALLQPPGTPYAERTYEQRYDALLAAYAGDAAMDRAQWGSQSHIDQTGFTLAQAIQRIKDEYLEPRRIHLYQTHSLTNTGYALNAFIPDAQPTNAVVHLGLVDFNPVSGIQDEEFIELINTNTYAVDLSGWMVTGGVEHVFAPSTVIPSFNATNPVNHHLYLSPNVGRFRSRTISPRGGERRFVQGNYQGHLSSFGETLVLLDAQGQVVDIFTYEGNPSAQQTSLVITEIHYHPEADEETEFVELLNISTNSVALNGVTFSAGIHMPLTNHLASGAVALVVRNQTAFEAAYGTGFPIIAEYQFSTDAFLQNGGERIKLEDPSNSTIKDFTYDDQAPWPVTADGRGRSLELIQPMRNPDPDLAVNWRSSLTPGGTPGVVYASAREAWMDRFFTPAEQTNMAVSAWTADPDGDLRSNDQEFVFGGDPRSGEVVRSIAIDVDQSLQILRRADSPEITYQLDVSLDLLNWQPADALFTVELLEDSDIPRYRFTPIQPFDGPRYFRQRATY
ncbi:MAG: hypothetical protein ACI97B_000290 [Verrucomicrobiales bacterium]